MPITPPDLDDLTYDRTVEELLRRLPVYAPELTDHNDSNPAVALIQLFAYLGEQVGYRLNRIPEKVHVELLLLLGIKLDPARAARSRVALLLADPRTATALTLPAGARVKAAKGQPPPTFETEVAVDVVPAQPVALVTTRSPFLWDLGRTAADDTAPPYPVGEKPKPNRNPWVWVTWDGKKPKLKDLPLDPVPLRPEKSDHRFVWVGLAFNDAPGQFRGVPVTLTVQFDDDEQPDPRGATRCCPVGDAAESAPEPVTWLAYFDAAAAAAGRPPETWVAAVPGRIDDGTAHMTRSGTIRFTVPPGIGAPAVWGDLRPASAPSATDACLEYGSKFGAVLKPGMPDAATVLGANTVELAQQLVTTIGGVFTDAADKGLKAAEKKADAVVPAIPHPLGGEFRFTGGGYGWLRIALPRDHPGRRVRMVTFNAVPVVNAATVANELIGVGDGRQGQTFKLANGNVLEDTLELAVEENADQPPVRWAATRTLDDAGPDDRLMAFDPEAGRLTAGDGDRGRIVPLVPRGGRVVAVRYKAGGGAGANLPPGGITTIESAARGVEWVVNFVAAAGGRDAETLDGAKARARKEISSRSRAVTAGDFEWIATRTPGVEVGRAVVVPLRRPLRGGPPGVAWGCGPVGGGAVELDRTTVAHGAVSVVVVPNECGPEPVPTPSFRKAVCDYLDRHRLVTTEVYVVPPQYCRLSDFRVRVKAAAGFTRAMVQARVEAALAGYLHPLRGGPDGAGFRFGGTVHVADLMTLAARTEGVARVESLEVAYTRTKQRVAPRAGRLMACPTGLTGEVSRIDLDPDECASVDLTAFTLSTSG